MKIVIAFALLLVAVGASALFVNSPVHIKDIFGAYLKQGAVDSKLALTKTKDESTVWRIVPYGDYHLIKSYVGTYVQGMHHGARGILSYTFSADSQWRFTRHGNKWSILNIHYRTFIRGRDLVCVRWNKGWEKWYIFEAKPELSHALAKFIDVPVTIRGVRGYYMCQNQYHLYSVHVTKKKSACTTWLIKRTQDYYRVRSNKGMYLQGKSHRKRVTVSRDTDDDSLFEVTEHDNKIYFQSKSHKTYVRSTTRHLDSYRSRDKYGGFTIAVVGKKADQLTYLHRNCKLPFCMRPEVKQYRIKGKHYDRYIYAHRNGFTGEKDTKTNEGIFTFYTFPHGITLIKDHYGRFLIDRGRVKAEKLHSGAQFWYIFEQGKGHIIRNVANRNHIKDLKQYGHTSFYESDRSLWELIEVKA